MFIMILLPHSSFGQEKSGIIPAPASMDIRNEKSQIDRLVLYVLENPEYGYIKALARQTPGIALVTSPEGSNITLEIDGRIPKEAYELYIEDKQVKIYGGSAAGLQYGFTSLHQLILNRNFPLPKVVIKDNPEFSYRGMHLDVARHFFTVAEVKKYLDFMAFYKYNAFHWHLTEDQGWRIEIKKYPKLQEIAAYRKETLIGHYNDQPHQFDGKKYGGYYTQDDVKDIVAYASERNIDVIPEIEMPGHSLAALAAYPELGCGPGPYEVATKWGVFEDVYCPTEKTFKFLEDVIDEVVSIFPGKYIHIGGDECPKIAWKNSSFCQELIKKEGLKDEHGLQSYFITRMEKYINSKGKQIIGWDEILEGGLAPNATVMSWRGIEGGLEAARQNHDVIMTPGSHCYFDHYQSENANEPLAIGGYTPIEKVYAWQPIPENLTADKRKYILGGQANLWTEYIQNFSKLEYMAYARGIAMSEALWSKNKNYNAFLQRYELHHGWWTAKGSNMAYHIYELKPKITAGVGKSIKVSFDLPIKTAIGHSIDKTLQPDMNSGESFEITQSGLHTFFTKINGKEGTPIKLNFDLHKGTTAKISFVNPPSEKYSGNGAGSIINGIKGSNEKYGGSEWLGFEGTDAIAIVEFAKATQIDEISCRFFKGEGQWIYLPKKVTLEISKDGNNYTPLQINQVNTQDGKISNVSFKNLQASCKFLKIKAQNFGIIPEGAQGASHGSWLFMDEIIIK